MATASKKESTPSSLSILSHRYQLLSIIHTSTLIFQVTTVYMGLKHTHANDVYVREHRKPRPYRLRGGHSVPRAAILTACARLHSPHELTAPVLPAAAVAIECACCQYNTRTETTTLSRRRQSCCDGWRSCAPTERVPNFDRTWNLCATMVSADSAIGETLSVHGDSRTIVKI